MNELTELYPAIHTAEVFTIESAFIGWRCLEGEENVDWVYLKDRDKLNWELN